MKKIGELIDERCSSLVFWSAWAAYAATYVGRINYSAALAGMVNAQVFTKAQGGIIGTVFFFCYGSGQLLNGYLGDRISPFAMIFTGLFVSLCMNCLMSLMPSPLWLSLVWGVNGLAQSMIWSPIVRIISQVLHRAQRVRACLNIASTIPAGTIAAYGLSMLMLRFFSWRMVFLAAGLCMLPVLLLWLHAWRRARHAVYAQPTELPTQIKTGPMRTDSLWPLLLSSGVVLLVLPTMLHGMLKDGVTTWVPTMIMESYRVTPSFSLLLALLLPIINLGGAAGATYVCNRFCQGNEIKAACWCALALVPLLLALCFIGKMPALLSILLLGLTSSILLGFNHMVITLVPVRFGRYGKASTITGALNSAIYLGCAFSNYGFGLLAQTSGWQATVLCWLGLALADLILCLFVLRRWNRFLESGTQE